MTTRHVTAFRNLVLSACMLAGLAACATTKPPTALPVANEQGFDAFEAGQAALSCGAACATAWQSAQPELSSLYQTGEWRTLAQRVMEINYKQDLGYFYLGRAAEELRRREAALTYYRAATDIATGPDDSAKCSASATQCSGVKLLTEALARIQIVGAPRSAAIQRRGVNTARPGAASPWVDPPPVSPQ